jgi:death-on-curing protein
MQRPPAQIYPDLMQMFETGTFDIAHLDPWLRGFATAEVG